MELKNGVSARVRWCTAGQTMTEYSLIVLFVGIAAYSAYAGLGLGIKTFAGNVVTFITAAVAAL